MIFHLVNMQRVSAFGLSVQKKKHDKQNMGVEEMFCVVPYFFSDVPWFDIPS